MTKKFVLADTLPTPYFTVDAGAEAALEVRVAPRKTKGETRMSVEVWRDNTILCRLFGKSAEIADNLKARRSGMRKQMK